MTEDTGFPFRPEPAVDETDPAPETAPGAGTVDVQDTAPEPAEDVTAAEDTSPASQEAVPFVPSEGVADWLRDFILNVHRRLTNLGG